MSEKPNNQWLISSEQAKEISWRLSGYKVQAKIDEILESLPEVSSELRTQAAKIEAQLAAAQKLNTTAINLIAASEEREGDDGERCYLVPAQEFDDLQELLND